MSQHDFSKDDITIRKAKPTDARAIRQLDLELFKEPDNHIPISPEEIMSEEGYYKMLLGYRGLPNSVFFVAEYESKIVGFVLLKGGRYRAVQHSALLAIGLDKNVRGKKLGDRLIKEAVAWAKSSEMIKRIELKVFENNARARKLYENNGFVLEGKRQKSVFKDGQYFNDLEMALLLG